MADPLTGLGGGDVRVRIEAAALSRAMRLAPDIVAEELTAGVTEASLLAEREVIEMTPTYQGLLRNSIGALPVEISGEAVRSGVGTSLAYAAPVEFGARPHWMPVEPLIEWATRKLGLTGADAKRVAGAIRYKIATRGTEGRFMFRDGVASVSAQMVAIIETAIDRASARIQEGRR